MDEAEAGLPPLGPDEYEVQVHGQTHRVRFLASGRVLVDGKPLETTIRDGEDGVFHMTLDDANFRFWTGGRPLDPREFDLVVNGSVVRGVTDDRRSLLRQRTYGTAGESKGPIQVKAPMPGLVTKFLVKPGMSVEKGQGMVVLEAMKMENEIRAETGGIVNEIFARERMPVEKGQVLLSLRFT